MALQFSATKVNYNKTAVIADNGTVSAAIDLEDGTLLGVFIPAGFVGTTLTLQASADNSTFVAVAGVSKTVAASNYVPFAPSETAGIRYVKFVSGSSETGGPLTLTAAFRRTI